MSADAGTPRILYCHCAYAQAVPKPVKQQVLQTLTASGVEFEAVPDLCEMSAKRDPALAELAGCGALTIVACYPRAVTWLFNAAGAPLAEGVRVLNMRTETAEAVAAALPRRTERGAGAPASEPVGECDGRSPSVKR
ncbi:MAG: hypothetical protein WD690_19390 [Vicinamibacterales bacterium]